jgi:P pilus assembly chaperone PapD
VCRSFWRVPNSKSCLAWKLLHSPERWLHLLAVRVVAPVSKMMTNTDKAMHSQHRFFWRQNKETVLQSDSDWNFTEGSKRGPNLNNDNTYYITFTVEAAGSSQRVININQTERRHNTLHSHCHETHVTAYFTKLKQSVKLTWISIAWPGKYMLALRTYFHEK